MTKPHIVIPPAAILGVIETMRRHNAQLERECAERAAAIGSESANRSESLRLPEMTVIEHVTEQVLAACYELCDLWHDDPDEPIAWDSFWDRLEQTYNMSIENPDSPVAQKIQRAVRKHRQSD